MRPGEEGPKGTNRPYLGDRARVVVVEHPHGGVQDGGVRVGRVVALLRRPFQLRAQIHSNGCARFFTMETPKNTKRGSQ